MKLYKSIFFILSVCVFSLQAQVNQYNEDGTRQGLWQKNFEGTNQIRYIGQFNKGIEVGEFRFFKKGFPNMPTAIKIFSENGTKADVTFFTQRGNVICKGVERNKKREGKWIYYHRDGKKVMVEEYYVDGKQEGEQITYYENGVVSERVSYVNDQKHGKELVYSVKGVLIKEFTYVNGLLEGVNKFYSGRGHITIEGMYKQNKKIGVWNYYDANGKIIDQKRHK